ncbi:MAG: hypothetical protein GY898_09055 [Proteobacteria bacterium]|nr:hypothetical protein [Pseudomonadota bacterium]
MAEGDFQLEDDYRRWVRLLAADPQVAAQQADELCQRFMDAGRMDAAGAVLEDVLVVDGLREEQIAALGTRLGRFLSLSGRHAEADRWFAVAGDAADATGRPYLRLEAAAQEGIGRLLSCRMGEAVLLLDRAAGLADDATDLDFRIHILRYLGHAHAFLAQLEEADEAYLRALAEADGGGALRWLAAAPDDLARNAHQGARLEDAEAYLAASEAAYDEIGRPHAMLLMHEHRATFRLEQGRVDEAVADLDRATSLMLAFPCAPEARLLPRRAQAQHLRGDVTGARDFYELARRGFEAIGEWRGEAFVLAWQAVLESQDGRPDEAALLIAGARRLIADIDGAIERPLVDAAEAAVRGEPMPDAFCDCSADVRLVHRLAAVPPPPVQ